MDIRNEILPLERLRLRPGVGYTVIAPFVDDDTVRHELNERWIFLGFESPKMYPGYVIHVDLGWMSRRSFRLRWGSGGQADTMNAFHEYVRPPTVAVDAVLAALPHEDSEKLRGNTDLMDRSKGDADLLLNELRRWAGNAGIASDRSGMPNPYEPVAHELSRLASRIDQEISAITQGRFEV